MPRVLLVTKGLSLVLLLVVACGGSPGEAACRDYQKTVTEFQAHEINTFEFNERVGEIHDRARSAEPEIAQAAANLRHAVNTVSPERVAVAIGSMRDACVKVGYLQPGPMNPSGG
ncbi:MAG: hypothetical protein ACE5Q6_11930 [Dehalococcoidia bacterium]